MGLFVCETLPSDSFDGETMAIPYNLVQKISQRGSGGVWVTYWAEGHSAKRPLTDTWENNLTRLEAAS
jgi:hypothetical protein